MKDIKVMFISHQWLGEKHPDPHFRQFAKLQQAFQRMAMGELNVKMDIAGEAMQLDLDKFDSTNVMDWYVWYDYLSCPQDEGDRKGLQAAISSIAAYVDECDYFLVCAPALKHADRDEYCTYRTWQTRGWCRLEQAACVLSKKKKQINVLSSASSLLQVPGNQWITQWPGEGVFTCDSDRRKVLNVMESLLEQKITLLLRKQDRAMYRILLALKPRALQGLTSHNGRLVKEDVSDFLARYQFEAVASKQKRAGNLTPLMCAAIEGNTHVVRQLVAQQANMSQGITSVFQEYFNLTKGYTAFDLACGLSTPEMVECLIELKADPKAPSASGLGNTGLHMAAYFNLAAHAGGIVDILMDHGCSPDHLNDYHTTALDGCGITSNLVVGQRLLERGAKPCLPGKLGLPSISVMLAWRADIRLVQLMIEYGADLDQRCKPGGVWWLLAQAGKWQSRNGLGSTDSELFAMLSLGPAPPLHYAAFAGQEPHARLLIEHKANPRATNSAGKISALDVARQRKEEEVDLLLTSSKHPESP
jgi:hypothetical protein